MRCELRGATRGTTRALLMGMNAIETIIVQVCKANHLGAKGAAVRLSALRPMVWADRTDVDAALRALHDRRVIVLSRDDNTAQLTGADHSAALLVGGHPRHLFYFL